MKFNHDMLNHMLGGGGFVRWKWGNSSPCVTAKKLDMDENGTMTIILQLLYRDGRREDYVPSDEDRKADDWTAVDIAMDRIAHEMGYSLGHSSPENKALSLIPSKAEE